MHNVNLALGDERAYRRMHNKYNVAKVMHHAIELRVPSRVTCVADMKRRYELMYVLVDCARQSFEGNAPTWAKAMSRVKPIVSLMYKDDEKEQKIWSLAKGMQKFIKTAKMDMELMVYLDPYADEGNEFRTRRCIRMLDEGTRPYNLPRF